MTWKQKLNPARFPGMSPKMGAIVACILDIEVTKPVINSMIVTSDGFVLAELKGDLGYNEFLGAESDLNRNWTALLDVAKLTLKQRALAILAYMRHVRRI
jgi:hypothetical protein